MKKLNRKGFTLIELLAVIVILAVLMLLAAPSVINIMNNARQDSFKTEALAIIESAKTAYATDAMSLGTNGKCYGIKTNGILAKSYTDKDFTGYTGYVNIKSTTNASGEVETSYEIEVSNGTYKLDLASGASKPITAANYKQWRVVDGASAPTSPSGLTCD